MACPQRLGLLPRLHLGWRAPSPSSQAPTDILANAGTHPLCSISHARRLFRCLHMSEMSEARCWRAQAEILLLHLLGPRRSQLDPGQVIDIAQTCEVRTKPDNCSETVSRLGGQWNIQSWGHCGWRGDSSFVPRSGHKRNLALWLCSDSQRNRDSLTLFASSSGTVC